MTDRPCTTAIGVGLIALGPAVFVRNNPPGDMIWEWPSFGIIIWLIGIALLATALRSQCHKNKPDPTD